MKTDDEIIVMAEEVVEHLISSLTFEVYDSDSAMHQSGLSLRSDGISTPCVTLEREKCTRLYFFCRVGVRGTM